jgi:hypothetical protein
MKLWTKMSQLAVVAMALLILLAGCSERATDSQSPGTITFNLKPSDGQDLDAVTRARATIVSLSNPDAAPVTIELTIEGNVVSGHIDGIPSGWTRIIIEVWDEFGTLIMQGTRDILVTPIVTQDVDVSLDSPQDRIDNDIVALHFDHAHGCIDSLRLKTGTNLDLLDQTANITTAVYGLGGLFRIDNQTQLVSYLDYGDSVVLSYANAAYGTKTFHLTWSAANDFEINMEFFVVETLLVTLGNSWSPGGDNVIGDGDSLAIRIASAEADIYPVRYDTTEAELYAGSALSVAWFTADQEEVLGYRFPTLRQIRCHDGSRAEGPVVDLIDGYHQIDFAVKRSRMAFVVWAVGQLPQ